MIQIRLVDAKAQSYSLRLTGRPLKLRDLRREVESKTGVPSFDEIDEHGNKNAQKLFFQQKEIQEDADLAEIQDGDVIHMIEEVVNYMDGESYLHLVAFGGNMEAVKLLIEAGEIDIESVNNWNQTPIHYASNVEILEILIGVGANVKNSEIRAYFGCLPAHEHFAKDLSPFMEFCSKRSPIYHFAENFFNTCISIENECFFGTISKFSYFIDSMCEEAKEMVFLKKNLKNKCKEYLKALKTYN